MSPSHREPPQRNEGARSVWTTTWIFITLIALTVLMAIFVNGIVRESQHPAGIEMSAGRKP